MIQRSFLVAALLAAPGCSCLGIHHVKELKRSGGFECEARSRVVEEGKITHRYNNGITLRFRGEQVGDDAYNHDLASCEPSPGAAVESVAALNVDGAGSMDVYGADAAGTLRGHCVTDHDGTRHFQLWDATGRYYVTSGVHWDGSTSHEVAHIWDAVAWSEPERVVLPQFGSLVGNSPDATQLLFVQGSNPAKTAVTLFSWRAADGQRTDFTYPLPENAWMLQPLYPARPLHRAHRLAPGRRRVGLHAQPVTHARR